MSAAVASGGSFGSVIELSEPDAGTRRSVAVGDHLVIRLAENRTTGYRWAVAFPPDAFTVLDDTYEPAVSGTPGAPGVRILRLRAAHTGAHEVAMVSRRSWETGPAAAPTLRFTVDVNA